MSIVEYARTFSVSDMTIRRRIKTGKLRAELRDGKYYIPVRSGAEMQRHAHDDHEHDSSGSDFSPTANEQRTAAPQVSRPQVQHRSVQESLQRSQPAVDRRVTYSEPVAVRPAPDYSYPTRHSVNAVSDHVSQPAPTNYTKSVQPTVTTPMMSPDVNRIVEMCESAIKSFSNMERRLEEQYKARTSMLESKLAARDAEIESLQQKIQDLQLLISILEKKKL